MTEDEAKTKWCPMVRHEGDEGGSFNRGLGGNVLNIHEHNRETTCNCIGSDCMMWVEDTMFFPKGESRPEMPSTGHCGLVK